MKRLGVWVLLMLARAAGAGAGSGAEAVPLAGLESDPVGTVFPQACAVQLAGDKVTVTLTAESQEQKPALLINGESFGWTGASGNYADRQFPELEIRVDGEPIAPGDRFEAYSGAADITNMLISLQMDPWAVTHTPPVASARVPSAPVLTAMKHVGAIKSVPGSASGDYLATWTVRRLLRIPLKTLSEQRVELMYTARPGHAVLPVVDLVTPMREREYCISSRSLSRFKRRVGPEPLALSVDEYTVPVGIDGMPPSSVLLALQSGSAAREQVFLCAPHGNPIAKSGSFTAVHAGVDDRGVLHVLRVSSLEGTTGR